MVAGFLTGGSLIVGIGAQNASPEEPSEPETPAPEASDDLRDATTMFERLVFYVDRHPR